MDFFCDDLILRDFSYKTEASFDFKGSIRVKRASRANELSAVFLSQAKRSKARKLSNEHILSKAKQTSKSKQARKQGRVEHQKLNQVAASAATWLSFWCSIERIKQTIKAIQPTNKPSNQSTNQLTNPPANQPTKPQNIASKWSKS